MSECCGNGCGCHETPEADPNVIFGKVKLEYELVPTKSLERGEMVWIVQPDDSFIKYEII